MPKRTRLKLLTLLTLRVKYYGSTSVLDFVTISSSNILAVLLCRVALGQRVLPCFALSSNILVGVEVVGGLWYYFGLEVKEGWNELIFR